MRADKAILPAPLLVVEDDKLMQGRLHNMLLMIGYEAEQLLFCSSLAAAMRAIAQQKMGAVLVDLGLPDGNGTSLIAALRQQDANMAILVISAWSGEDQIMDALRAGASGYVLKERDELEVSLSIRSVLRGGTPIDPFIARRILAQLSLSPVDTPEDGAENTPDLTQREHEILNRVAEGLSNREIADKLFLSRHTVEGHIKNIYRKLAVSSRTKAVNTARSLGLLK